MHGRGLLIFFALTLLLPGAALAVFGARALIQERQLVDQQIRERVENAADTVARELERQFQDWQFALDQAIATLPAAHQPLVSAALAEPGAGVLLSVAQDRLTVWPRDGLLYDLTPSGLDGRERPKSAALIEAEAAEIERKDYAVATALYQQLLTVAHDDDRAELLHHLARTYRKSGRSQDALVLFEQLKTTAGFVGAVPASLIGHYEVCAQLALANSGDALAICAIDFYRRMITGEWHLSKERYSYYASTARSWAETTTMSAATVAELTTQATAKAALTTAAEALSARVCGAAPAASAFRAIATNEVLAISRCLPTPLGMNGRMLVISQAWLARHAWPPISAAAGGAYHVALIDRENRMFYSSLDVPGGAYLREHEVTRDTIGAADGWRVRVWPRDADALADGLTTRQRLYVLTLALVIASLMFGAYSTHRVVKRELQFAQLKSEFVSTVSHEFRSPLTAIRQLGEMLMRDRVPESRRPEYYERITRESERLGRLVENLLDFAQMEEGRKRYHLQPLDTADWLRRTVYEFQSVREGHAATVKATIPPSLPALRADAAALGCAIHNLLDNAIKYSPGADTVWLDAEGDSSCVTIRVRDRGVGIAESDRRQIFEKFFRVNGEITRQVKGAGLGLSLVHHIVAAHNGRIECESQPGHGTTFTIHLTAAAVSS